MSTRGFTKIGESLQISPTNVHGYESVLSDPIIEDRFNKFAAELRRIAPKANDFLYFSAIMMHAAEAALINPDGTTKLTVKGEPVSGQWEKKNESWKWVCSDSNIRPYKNSNGDIFPEEELLKAHKNWIGKPLCVDHKSSSVDAIRGVILDTVYDRLLKRVIALCALDKVSYPELARKVSTGYSTCVSMGTAVGRAICTDCGQVARTEGDFCQHMRTKSCYGEINVDLQPIELSIVVNGADPQAKIRTIIAAADVLNNYIRTTGAEINELSSSNVNEVKVDKLKELEEDLKEANEKLAELKAAIGKEDVEQVIPPYGATSGTVAQPEDETNIDFGLNLPERYATNNDAFISELEILKSSTEKRLHNMEKSLETLSNRLYTTKEEIMSAKDANMNKEAYFQGGGGVNEPTPGKPKYDKDPLNEKLRMEDKQMVGQHNLDTGPVDGMHPGPDSAGMSDEERKKMLLRAEIEQRALRRAAALNKAKENIMNTKEAYFHGGGGVNEPTPHKPKYPVDDLEYKLREKEDKHMVGQKPFPGVGAVDGMHPSPMSADTKDELARKKLLLRATLKARFVKAANSDGTEDITKSAWHVFVDDKLALTASVDEISGGRAEVLYDTIATKEFGSKMLEKIRSLGFDRAAGLYKKSQAVSGPGAAPGAPPDAGGAGAAPAMPDMGAPEGVDAGAPPAEDAGGKGDPKETALKLAEKVRDMSSDLLEAVRALTGEQSEMGELEGLNEAPKTAGVSLTALNNMRKELNSALIAGMKKSLAELREHHDELKLIATIDTETPDANQEHVDSIVDDAFTDAKTSIADAFRLMGAFVKYARGTEGLLKRAAEAEEAALYSIADEDENDVDSDDKTTEENTTEDDSNADDNDHKGLSEEDEDMLLPPHDESAEAEMAEMDEPMGDEELDLDALSADDENDDADGQTVVLPQGAPLPPGAKLVPLTPPAVPKLAPTMPGERPVTPTASSDFDLTTKEGRTAYRTHLSKVAKDPTGKEEDGETQDASKLQFSDMLDEANSLADGQTQLDVKPSDDLGYIETQEEKQKIDMEVAKAQPKVRKDAERLQLLISQGKVDPKDLDSLVSQGLDPEVVKYWKQYWGEAGKEGSEFATGLVKEQTKAKAAEEMLGYKVKIARAYDLANDMVRRGLLADDRSAIGSQVEEIMKWNDEAFESMKRVVAKHAPLSMRKEATGVPQVGLIGSGDNLSQNAGDLDLQSELDRAFSGRKY